VRRRRAADRQRREQPEQRRAAHVGADRLRRLPRDEREAEEGPGRDELALDRGEDLLLAQRAVEVGLARAAAVLAHARDCERLLAVEVVLAAAVAERHAAVAGSAADVGDQAVLEGEVDAAQRVDELREVDEVHLDDVVDVDPQVALERRDGQRGPADGVRGIDLVGAVAGDGDDRVARHRQARGVAAAGADQQQRVGAARLADDVGAALVRAGRAGVGADDQDRVGAERQRAAVVELVLGLVGDLVLLDLGRDEEQDERQEQPPGDRDGQPQQHPLPRDRPALGAIALGPAQAVGARERGLVAPEQPGTRAVDGVLGLGHERAL